jgi:DNA invertase Pin-like site-specific DNA recombinase
MMNLLNYTVQHHFKLEQEKMLTSEEAELAEKINRYFEEKKPLVRQEVLDYFGISKHQFYKLKNKNAINVPVYMTNRVNSNLNRVYTRKNIK